MSSVPALCSPERLEGPPKRPLCVTEMWMHFFDAGAARTRHVGNGARFPHCRPSFFKRGVVERVSRCSHLGEAEEERLGPQDPPLSRGRRPGVGRRVHGPIRVRSLLLGPRCLRGAGALATRRLHGRPRDWSRLTLGESEGCSVDNKSGRFPCYPLARGCDVQARRGGAR